MRKPSIKKSNKTQAPLSAYAINMRMDLYSSAYQRIQELMRKIDNQPELAEPVPEKTPALPDVPEKTPALPTVQKPAERDTTSNTKQETGHRNDTIPALLSAQSIFITSNDEQNRNLQEEINRSTADLDLEIKKLMQQKKDVDNQYNRSAKPFYTSFGAVVYQYDEGLATKSRDLQRKIDDLTRQKTQYVANMKLANNRQDLYKSILTATMLESDFFKTDNAALLFAKDRANSEYDKHFTNQRLFSIDETYGYYKDFNKSVQDLKRAYLRQYKISTQFDKLNNYIIDLVFNKQQPIPQSIDQFPADLLTTAKRAFTKDGKLLLEDPEFRLKLLSDTKRTKSDILAISNQIKKDIRNKDVRMSNADIQDKLKWIDMQKKAISPFGVAGRNSYQNSIGAPTNNPDDEVLRQLDVLENLYKQALQYKRYNQLLVDNSNAEFGKANTGRQKNRLLSAVAAFNKFFTDKNTYLFDLPNLYNLSRVTKINDKIIEGKELTQTERDLAEAAMLESLYHSTYGEYENYNAYKWSSIAAESLKFMAEFLATSGVAAGMLSAARGGAYGLLKKMAMNNVSKYGYKVAKTVLPAVSRVGADVAYAGMLTNTLGLPRVLKDMLEMQKQGSVRGDYSQFGGFNIDGIYNADGEKVTQRADSMNSFLVSEKRNFIENFSEMMGEYAIGSRLAKITRFSNTKLGKFLSEMEDDILKGGKNRAAKTAKDIIEKWEKEKKLLASRVGIKKYLPTLDNIFNQNVLRRGQFHGMFGEVAEEYYGLVMLHIMGVQDDPRKTGIKGLIDDIKEQSADIWGGILLSTGILGAVGMGSAIRQQMKYEDATRKLDDVFGNKDSYEIQRQLAFADNNALVSKYLNLASELGYGVSQDKLDALRDYFSALIKYRGAAYSERVIENVGMTLDEQARIDSKNRGYRLGSYNTSKRLNVVRDIIEREIEETLQNEEHGLVLLEDIKKAIDNNLSFATIIQDIIEDKYLLTPSETTDVPQYGTAETTHSVFGAKEDILNKVIALQNASAMLDGSDVSIADQIDDLKSYQTARFAKLTNIDTHGGKIVILGKPVELSSEESDEEQGDKQKHTDLVVLIKGTAAVDPNNKITQLNSSQKVLVANMSTAQYSYIPISDLEGYEYVTPDGLDPEVLVRTALNQIDANQIKQREEAYKSIDSSLIVGSSVALPDGKMLTILNIGKDGIEYAIHDSAEDDDLKNAEMHHVDSILKLKEFINNLEEDYNTRIVADFKDTAETIRKQMELNDRAYNEFLEKSRKKETDSADSKEQEGDSLPQNQSNGLDGHITNVAASERIDGLIHGNDFLMLKSPHDSDIIYNVLTTKEIMDMYTKTMYDIALESRSEEEVAKKVSDNALALGYDDLICLFELVDRLKKGEITEDEFKNAFYCPISIGQKEDSGDSGSNGENETDDQKKAYEAISQIITSNKKMFSEGLSSFHYIMNDGVRSYLHRRVHSMKEGVRPISDEDKTVQNDYYKRLKEATIEQVGDLYDVVDDIIKEILEKVKSGKTYNDQKTDEGKKWYIGLVEKYIRYSVNIGMYKNYLTKYNDESDVDEVAFGLATILAERFSEPLIGPSVQRGALIDEVFRKILANDVSPQRSDVSINIFGTEYKLSDEIEYYKEDGSTKKIEIITEDAYSELVKQLEHIKNYYKVELGWKMITDEYIVHGTIRKGNKSYRVAGATDCIGIDAQGRYHLIDFKTYAHSKGGKKKYYLHEVGGQYFQSNFFLIQNKAEDKISYAQDYATQEGYYSMLAQLSDNIQFADRSVLLLGINEQHERMYMSIKKENIATSEGNSAILITEDGRFVPNIVYLDETCADPNVKQALEEIQKIYDNTIRYNRGESDLTFETYTDFLKSVPEIDKVSQTWSSALDQEELYLIQDQVDIDIITLKCNHAVMLGGQAVVVVDDFDEQERNTVVESLAKLLILQSSGIKIHEDLLNSAFYLAQKLNLLPRVQDAIYNMPDDEIDDKIEYHEPTKSGFEVTGLINSAEGYSNVENSVNKDGEKLSSVTGNSDFINESTFELIIKDGTEDNQFPSILMVVTYRGEKYSPVDINFAHNSGGLYAEAKSLYDSIIGRIKSGERIMLDNSAISRTNGIILNSDVAHDARDIIKEFVGKGVYDIEYSSQSTDFGLTKVIIKNKTPQLVVQTPNIQSEKRRKRIIYRYMNSHRNGTNPANGVVVMMCHAKHDEKQHDQTTNYPINIFTSRFEPQLAQFVADLISGKYSNSSTKDIDDILSSNYVDTHTQSGERLETPLTVQEILNLYISSKSHNYIGKNHVHLEFDGSIVKIVGNIEGVSDNINTFDFSKPEKIDEFVKFLSNHVRLLITESVLKSRFDEEGIKTMFQCGRTAIFDYFKSSSASSIWIGGKLISKEHLSDTRRNVSTENKHKPISGLGWYVDQLFLTTTFEGFDNPLISIDETKALVGLLAVPKSGEKKLQPGPKQEGDHQRQFLNADGEQFTPIGEGLLGGSNTGGKRLTLDSFYNGEDGLLTSYSIAEIDTELINETDAILHIRDLVGEWNTLFEDKMLESVTNRQLAGLLRSNVLKIARNAKAGVEYHEAFHIILELIMDDKQRQKYYNQYRKKFGEDLTDRDITERAADEFWWFMDNKFEFKWQWNFKKLFLQIVPWYKFYSKIGSFTLVRLYRSAANGKFKNIKPTIESIKRFNKKFGHLASYSVPGMKDLTHISSGREYMAAINTVRTIILDSNTYKNDDIKMDPTGSNLNMLEINLPKIVRSPLFATIMGSPQYNIEAKQMLMDVLGIRYANNDYYQVNYNFSVILGQIMGGLKQFGAEPSTRSKKLLDEAKSKAVLKQDTTIEDPDGEGLSNIMLQEKGIFQLTSAEISSIERTSPSVKFFFSRLFKYEKEPLIDDNGNIKYSYSIAKNAAGLPYFMDLHEVWNIILNKVHKCGTIFELYTTLEKLSEEDEQFAPVFMSIRQLVRKAYKLTEKDRFFSDDGIPNEVLDLNVHGHLTQIVSYIHQAKTIPDVVLSMQDTTKVELKGSTRVLNADNDYVCKQIKQSWCDLFISGDIPAISIVKGQMLFGSDKMRDPISVASFFNALGNMNDDGTFDKSIKCQTRVTLNLLDEDGNIVGESTTIKKNLSSLNAAKPEDLDLIKYEFVRRLGRYGIIITIDDLDHLIVSKTGKTGFDGFRQFCKTYQGLLFSISSSLKGCKIGNSKLVMPNVAASIWSENKLCTLLAAAKYDRLEQLKEMQFLTIGGKRIYAMSEHNYITSSLDLLLEGGSEKLKKLMNDPYHVGNNNDGMGYYGSRVLIAMDLDLLEKTAEHHEFVFRSIYGLKTDVPGSEGVEYLDLSTLEDVIVKYAVLASGGLLFPTLSDKTTYGAVFDASGKFKTVGINWNLELDNAFYYTPTALRFASDKYISKDEDGSLLIDFDIDTIDYFRNVFKCEYESAKLELKRIEQNVKFGHADQVESFHTAKWTNKDKTETHTVYQGARLSTFLGVHVIEDDGNGALRKRFVSFNTVKDKKGNYTDEKTCLKTAEEYYFSKSDDEQRMMVRRILSEQTQKELNYLLKNDMIIVDADNHYKNSESCGLDIPKLKRVQSMLSGISSEYTPESPNTYIMNFKYEESGHLHNDAIIAYAADMVIKQLQSMQEMFRIYAGNFSCFKWQYDSDGRLIDTTTDFFKRTGGFVSTGQYNVQKLPGINYDVRCAEIHDEKVVDDLYYTFKDDVKKQSVINQYMDIYMRNFVHDGKIINITIDNIENYSLDVYAERERLSGLDYEQLKEEFHKLNDRIALDYITINGSDWSDEQIVAYKQRSAKQSQDVFKMIESIANSKTSKLANINVNDGATFISDEFCERLLRVIGKWDSEIETAFKILRSASNPAKSEHYTNKLVLTVAAAYNLVLTTVIGSQKYTAYGRHFNDITVVGDSGDKVTYTRATTYYDKTSYIPIFSCMATGHMKAVLLKMKDQDIDVLKLSSAIKEGGKGAVDLNQEVFDSWDADTENYKQFKFNPYIQDLNDIRKQFNTDPKHGVTQMSLGTQYVKVVLALLKADQVYSVDGVLLNAKEMREEIMNAFKKHFEAQKEKFDQKYFKDGELDVEKFVEMLQQQLADRDPLDPIRRAFEVEDKIVNGEKVGKKLKLPISALSSSSWIESIVTSVVNKELININTPGLAFYQRPDWAMEGQMSSNYVGHDDFDHTMNHGAKLKQVNEEGSIDCVLSIDYFDYLFDKHENLKNQSFEEKKQWLIKHGIISGWDLKVKHVEKGIELEDVISKFKLEYGSVYKDEHGKIITIDDPNDDRIGTEVTGVMWKHAHANIVGYRIPTQAVSSIQAMRCVDVLPVVCHTVILPQAITGVTGSDFDIDKFFLSTLFYKSVIKDDTINQQLQELDADRSNLKRQISELKLQLDAVDESKKSDIQDLIDDLLVKLDDVKSQYNKLWSTNYIVSSDDYDVSGSEYNANRLLKLQISLLKTVHNNISDLLGSIDSDTNPLENVAKKIEKRYKKEELHSLDATSMQNNVEAKIAFAIGKHGIGPYALNNNNHVLTMLYGVKFVHNDKSILNLLDLEDLSRRHDLHGRPILSWLSGLINAHVDVAKNPYIRSLGVNQYTYNLVSLLIRTGYGEETFWFTTQPIMNQLYSKYDLASGVYNLPEGTSASSRLRSAVTEFYFDFVKSVLNLDKSCVNMKDAKTKIDDYIAKKYKTASYDMILHLMKTESGVKTMEQISCSPESDIEEKYDIGMLTNVDYKDILVLTLLANFELLEYAQELSKLVQYTKIDTKKQGKTIIEQSAYMLGFYDLLDPDKSAFEIEGIRKMIHGTFIGPKTTGAINIQQKMLQSQLIQATDGYKKLVNRICRMLNRNRDDVTFMLSVNTMIMAKIKSDYFFTGQDSYCTLREIEPGRLLTHEDDSIYSQLKRLQSYISDTDNKRYSYLRNPDGSCRNYLLANLICGNVNDRKAIVNHNVIEFTHPDYNDAYENAKFIVRLNDVTEHINEMDMKNAWCDMLNDSDHPEVQRFAEQLIVYSFITSAGKGGSTSLFKYVPEQWMIGDTDVTKLTGFTGNTFGLFMEQMIDLFNQDEGDSASLMYSDEELESLIVNFLYDSNIVPTIKASTVERHPRFMLNGLTPMFFAPVFGFGRQDANIVWKNEDWPGFVKVRTTDKNIISGRGLYNVYLVVAVGRAKTKDDKYIDYPIYAIMDPSGGSYQKGNKIFDIGFTDQLLNEPTTTRPQYYERTKLQLAQLTKNPIVGLKLFIDEYVTNPTRLFQQLLHLSATDETKQTVNSVLDNLIEYESLIENIVNYDILKDFLNGVVNYESAKSEEDDIVAPSAKDVYRTYAYTMKDRGLSVTEDGYRTPDVNTQINVDRIDDRYTRIEKDEFFRESGISLEQFDESIRNAPSLHIEFYKKKTTIGGKLAHNYVATFSIVGHKRFGFFELACDVDNTDGHFAPNGQYSIHFKTYYPKKTDTKYASVTMSERYKNYLFKYLFDAIPNGGLVSTWGSVSKGGFAVINNLQQYSLMVGGGLFVNTGENRNVTDKATGQLTTVPVWKKTTKEEVGKNIVTSSPNPAPRNSGHDASSESGILEAIKQSAESSECQPALPY